MIQRPYSENMETPTPKNWLHLRRKPGSVYRQLFVNGRGVAASTLYAAFVNVEEPRTAEQIAEDYGVPLDAVRESIAYVASNPPEIQEDWKRDEATSAQISGQMTNLLAPS
jgi:hypothetical protein